MADAAQILHFDEEPIHIPAGPLTDGTRQKIEHAVDLNVPADKHLVVLACVDPGGLRFASAYRMGDHFKLAAEADRSWGGKTSGYVGIVGVF